MLARQPRSGGSNGQRASTLHDSADGVNPATMRLHMLHATDCGIGAAGHAVLVAIMAHADDETRTAWPSLDTLADLSGVGRRQARRCVKQLEACGVIEVAREARDTSTYRLPTLEEVLARDPAMRGSPVTPEGEEEVLRLDQPREGMLSLGDAGDPLTVDDSQGGER